MATSFLTTLRAVSVKKVFNLGNSLNQTKTWTRTAFFRRRKDKTEEGAEAEQKVLEPAVVSRPLKKRTGIEQIRPYTPPADLETRIQQIMQEVCGSVPDWKKHVFENNRMKFKVLTRMMAEFDHYIPNTDLSTMKSISDAIRFFSTPVHDTSALADISKLDLPPNLHIQMDPLRFNPDTDTMFGGLSAFPENPTVVSSLKYKRKYGKKQ